MVGDEEKARQAGCDDYMAKPIHEDHLLAKIRHFMDRTPMTDKILIVDDEPFNLDLLEQELADRGYAVERARNGAEALQKNDACGRTWCSSTT